MAGEREDQVSCVCAGPCQSCASLHFLPAARRRSSDLRRRNRSRLARQTSPNSAKTQKRKPQPCAPASSRRREATEKRAAAITAAGERKASPKEACQLFGAFVTAQTKMLKFANENATWCGIPNQVMVSLKEGLAKTSEIRNRVCQVAAAPPRPAGPSLSDALSGPVPDSNNIKTGRGTFDTLTGNPLEKK